MIRGKRKKCLPLHMTQDVVEDFIDGRIQRGAKVIKKLEAAQNAGADAALGPANENTYDE